MTPAKGAKEQVGTPLSLPKPTTVRFLKPFSDPSSTFWFAKLKGHFKKLLFFQKHCDVILWCVSGKWGEKRKRFNRQKSRQDLEQTTNCSIERRKFSPRVWNMSLSQASQTDGERCRVWLRKSRKAPSAPDSLTTLSSVAGHTAQGEERGLSSVFRRLLFKSSWANSEGPWSSLRIFLGFKACKGSSTVIKSRV